MQDVVIEVEIMGRSGYEGAIKFEDLGRWGANAPSNLVSIAVTEGFVGGRNTNEIHTSSKVGIGTDNPSDYGGSDHINSSIEWNEGSANWEFKSYRADGQSGSPYGNIDFLNGSTTSPTLTLRIATNNNVAIGHSSPTEKLHVAGNILATGTVNASSDISLKDNITTIPNAIDKVLHIRGVTFNRNDIEDNPRHAGVIAQEVEKVLPEVVSEGKDGIKSVAYGNMVGLLIEAIKEQQGQINMLKEKLENK